MKKFAVLAEDTSDAEALTALVKRISGNERLSVSSKGFGRCGHLRSKAESHINNFARRGCTHFILCHDADEDDPKTVRRKVRAALSSKLIWSDDTHSIIVPVQEIEAWMIADEAALVATIPKLSISPVDHPESISRPKEWLVDKSRKGRSSPLYAPAIFNPQVAKVLDLDKDARKCPSFQELVTFVRAE
jgi:hypothetical protein